MAAIKEKMTLQVGQRWRLTDAKARFSEVVKLAHDRPQRITVDGRDAVVIVDADTYDREHRQRTGADLINIFADPVIAEFDFERMPVTGPMRDVEL